MPVRIYTPKEKIPIADVSAEGDRFCLCFKKANRDIYETITLDQFLQIMITAFLKQGNR